MHPVFEILRAGAVAGLIVLAVPTGAKYLMDGVPVLETLTDPNLLRFATATATAVAMYTGVNIYSGIFR